MDEGNSPKTVAFSTLGCKLNRAETEMMREAFEARGFHVVKFSGPADVYVVNTCTVTGSTDHQCRKALHHALRLREKNPCARVIATGCYAQTNPEGLRALVSGIDLVAGNVEKTRLADMAVELLESNAPPDEGRTFVSDIREARTLEPPPVARFAGLTRAYLRVQDGCDRRCAYCIIPFARGPSRSLAPDRALDQARALAHAGHQEIVITGIHAGCYGRDLWPRTSLAALLRALHGAPGMARLRLSSMEPREFSPDLLDTLAELPGVCPHFHISLQSGDAGILTAMRRNYSPDDFAAVTRALRERMPDVCVGADVIVGFPGESDAAFQNTCALVQELELSYLHIFRYSPRPGTPAADMPDQVDEQTKKQRSAALHKIKLRLSRTFQEQFAGRILPVLFEHVRAPGGALTGLTHNYLRVTAPGAEQLMGRVVPVRIVCLSGNGLCGEIVEGA